MSLECSGEEQVWLPRPVLHASAPALSSAAHDPMAGINATMFVGIDIGSTSTGSLRPLRNTRMINELNAHRSMLRHQE